MEKFNTIGGEIFLYLSVVCMLAMKDRVIDSMEVMLKQPYGLTMSRHKFNAHEMRIMLRIIQALQPRMVYDKSPFELKKTDLGDTKVTIPTKYLLPRGTKNHEVVRNALESLTKKHINIKFFDDNGIVKEIFTNLVKEGSYQYRSEFVGVEISRNLMPQLLGLAKNYTRYLLKVAFNSSSPNVMKLYQYASQWRDKKQTFAKVDSLRKWLRLEGKYKKPADMKKWVLDPAIKELKAKADVWFDIAERVMEGRRMIGWKFNIHTKNTPKKALKKLLTQSPKQIQKPLSKLEEKLYKTLGLSPKQIQKIVRRVPEKDIEKELYQLNLLILDKKIANPAAYAIKIFKSKHGVKF